MTKRKKLKQKSKGKKKNTHSHTHKKKYIYIYIIYIIIYIMAVTSITHHYNMITKKKRKLARATKKDKHTRALTGREI